MNSVREIQRLNKLELEQGVPPSASWHTDYRDTAYVYVGGLSFDLTEGDVITIFSQFGEPTFVKLARDKTTGKSRGFGWVKYEDQRSCDLAVDNLGGATVLGRIIRVDHTRYQKRDDEDDGAAGKPELAAVAEVRRSRTPEAKGAPARPLLKEEIELNKLLVEHDDDDPMKEYLVDEKKKEVEEALARQQRKEERRGHRDHKRTRDRRGDLPYRKRERRRSTSHDDDDDDLRRHRYRDEGRHDRRHRRSSADNHESHADQSHRRRSRSRDRHGSPNRRRDRDRGAGEPARRRSPTPERRRRRQNWEPEGNRGGRSRSFSRSRSPR